MIPNPKKKRKKRGLLINYVGMLMVKAPGKAAIFFFFNLLVNSGFHHEPIMFRLLGHGLLSMSGNGL